jgi:hypothetical protein
MTSHGYRSGGAEMLAAAEAAVMESHAEGRINLSAAASSHMLIVGEGADYPG